MSRRPVHRPASAGQAVRAGRGGARGRPPGGGSRSYKLSGVHGLNGGQVVLTADAETLTGDLACDSLSSIAATLQNGTTLTGAIQGTALTMDATSTWKVTADSILASLSNPTGASGNGMTNIYGNGHEVRYDANLPANSWLGGKAYDLASGGAFASAPVALRLGPRSPATLSALSLG